MKVLNRVYLPSSLNYIILRPHSFSIQINMNSSRILGQLTPVITRGSWLLLILFALICPLFSLICPLFAFICSLLVKSLFVPYLSLKWCYFSNGSFSHGSFYGYEMCFVHNQGRNTWHKDIYIYIIYIELYRGCLQGLVLRGPWKVSFNVNGWFKDEPWPLFGHGIRVKNLACFVTRGTWKWAV